MAGVSQPGNEGLPEPAFFEQAREAEGPSACPYHRVVGIAVALKHLLRDVFDDHVFFDKKMLALFRKRNASESGQFDTYIPAFFEKMMVYSEGFEFSSASKDRAQYREDFIRAFNVFIGEIVGEIYQIKTNEDKVDQTSFKRLVGVGAISTLRFVFMLEDLIDKSPETASLDLSEKRRIFEELLKSDYFKNEVLFISKQNASFAAKIIKRSGFSEEIDASHWCLIFDDGEWRFSLKDSENFRQKVLEDVSSVTHFIARRIGMACPASKVAIPTQSGSQNAIHLFVELLSGMFLEHYKAFDQ